MENLLTKDEINRINKIQMEHNYYNDILNALYKLERTTRNSNLKKDIEYIKGIRKGLRIALEINKFQKK